MFWYFFDDILVYNKTKEEHLGHLRQVFAIMKENKMFAKNSKCAFMSDR